MFLHTIAIPEQAPAADGIVTHDLPTNPISALLLVLRPLNDTGTLSNFASYLKICEAINRVSVMYRGESIFGMRGEDAAALAYFRHGILPMQATHLQTDNFRRNVVLPLLFGRNVYDSNSCFPRTKRGDLSIELDLDIADTGYDGLRYNIESIELPDAKPKEFEKKVQITHTFPSTGDQDIQLALGSPCRGMLLRATTGFTGAAPAPSFGRMRVTVDNREFGFSNTDWEVSQALASLWGRQSPTFDSHVHNVDGALTVGSPSSVGSDWQNYTYLDYDPSMDDKHVIEPAGKDVRLRCNVETANAVRVVPIEVMPASIVSQS